MKKLAALLSVPIIAAFAFLSTTTEERTIVESYSFGPSGYYQRSAALPARTPSLSRGGDYLAQATEQGVHRWSPDRFPLKVYISSGSNVPGYRSTFPALAARAFDEWQSVSGGAVSWTRTNNPYNADITVGWASSLPASGGAQEAGRTESVTHFDRRTGYGNIQKARVTILTQLNRRPFNEGEVWRIALHEAGHAYGLEGHSPSTSDIMYFATSPNQPDQLSSRDIQTIRRLYGNYPQSGTAVASGGGSNGYFHQGYPTASYSPRTAYAGSYGTPSYGYGYANSYGNSYSAGSSLKALGKAALREMAAGAARRLLGGY